MWRWSTRGWLPLAFAGCVAGPPPMLEAHRTGAGYWPENSEYGVAQALAAGLEGIEIDLVLTADLVPVLHHDPALSVEHCTRADGRRFDGELLIRDLSLAELQEGYRCGGLRLPEHPQAAVVDAPVVTLDRVLEQLRDDARHDLVVHLDIKQEPGLTLPPSAFAEAIVGRWVEADLPQRVHLSSNLPDTLAAVRAEAAARGVSLETTLIWPRFPVGGSTSAVALRREGARLTGSDDYVSIAEAAGVDHIAVAWELADVQQLGAARRAGIGTMVWTPNEPRVIDRIARRWPVDVVITDYPGRQP